MPRMSMSDFVLAFYTEMSGLLQIVRGSDGNYQILGLESEEIAELPDGASEPGAMVDSAGMTEIFRTLIKDSPEFVGKFYSKKIALSVIDGHLNRVRELAETLGLKTQRMQGPDALLQDAMDRARNDAEDQIYLEQLAQKYDARESMLRSPRNATGLAAQLTQDNGNTAVEAQSDDMTVGPQERATLVMPMTRPVAAQAAAPTIMSCLIGCSRQKQRNRTVRKKVSPPPRRLRNFTTR